MNDLRLVLLLFGLAVIAGVYMLERFRARRMRLREPDPDGDADEFGGLNLKISPRGCDDDDVAPVLPALRNRRDEDISAPAAPVTLGREDAEQADAPCGDIISLHVVAAADAPFTGPALVAACRETGLEFGDMNIYHLHSMDGVRMPRPVFHVANMLEPGAFDPGAMDGFTTRGLTLFMQLPAPTGADRALDQMLDTARRLAQQLGGEVLTHDHRPLSETYVEALRRNVNGGN